jgi:hypothetical protein
MAVWILVNALREGHPMLVEPDDISLFFDDPKAIVVEFGDQTAGSEGVVNVYRRGEAMQNRRVVGVLLGVLDERERRREMQRARNEHRRPQIADVFVAAAPDERRVGLGKVVLAEPRGVWARHPWLVYPTLTSPLPIAVIDRGTVVQKADGAAFFKARQRVEKAAQSFASRKPKRNATTTTTIPVDNQAT